MKKEACGSLYPNPGSIDEDKFHLLFERWKIAVGVDTLNEEGISEGLMQNACETIFTEFPRGEGCGELLWEPVVDDTPLEHRGVSMEWLNHVWAWMDIALDSIFSCPIIPTRLLVVLFVEPFVLQPDQPKTGVIPFYYFVPVQFRGKPHFFLSHGWDSWVEHLLRFPRTSEPGQIAAMNGADKTFLWLDIFAIVQDPGSEKQQAEVAQIGAVVRSIGKTCIVLPGHGSIYFALLPARRSWCCFEITQTKSLSARVGFNKAHGISFHQKLIDEICQLNCANADTSNQTEKNAIQDLLEQEIGLKQADHMVRRAILHAFYERYDGTDIERPGDVDLDGIAPPCTVGTMYSQALNSLRLE